MFRLLLISLAAQILEIADDTIAIGDDNDKEDTTVYSRITRIENRSELSPLRL